MLTKCFAALILFMLGVFAFGSSEIVSERAERRRIEKLLKEKYPPVY